MDDYVERPVIRCWHCTLRQYVTHDGNCRRCHQPFIKPAPLAPIIEHPLPEHSTGKIGWGKVLERLRRERGLSQRALGYRMHTARTAISKLERRPRPPSLGTAFRLAEALEVPLDAMVAMVQSETEESENDHLVFPDPLIEELLPLVRKLSAEQRIILMDTVRCLALHQQLSFPEWEMVRGVA